jgi:replication factor A1
MKVSELSSASRQVDIRLRIISMETPREVRTRYGKARVTNAIAGDETGTIKLSLWNEDIDKIDEDVIVEIKNGFVKSFRGELELSSGRYGELAIVEDPKFPSREEIPIEEQPKDE